MTVRLSPQARRDIAQAAQYYEREREGIGDKFVSRVGEAIERVEANPQGYALTYRQLRKCDLRKFPYSLWFEIRPDNSLVVACLHNKRDRILVKERAAGVIEIPKPEP